MKRPSPKSKLAAVSTRWALAAACCCAALSGLSCNEEVPPPQPARFNRPNRVDLVCVNGTQVVAREQCSPGSTRLLHALVTQAGRGEIAVVNLGTDQVVDSRRDIPGYTFIPIGETPTAIVIPPQHPEHTYVASFGSRDVRVLRTRSMIATVEELPDAQRIALTTDGGETLLAPGDMVLAPDESALFVAVPDASLVLRLPIQRCDAASAPDCEDGLIDEAGIDLVELPPLESLPPPVEPAMPSVYQELCDFPRTWVPTPAPIDRAELDRALLDAPALARPSALALDAFCLRGESCTQRLLVADAAQPVIHAIDLDAWARGEDELLPPIVTGVPTKDVVVTPRVPRTVDGAEETQYVYAIEAGDGSVLVIEDGQVLNVNGAPGQRSDRLLFSGGREGALALEVMTPAFDVHGPAAQWVKSPVVDQLPAPGDPLACVDTDYHEPTPARLRGVFLAAALTDGTVHVIDVHDMGLRSSNGDSRCRACPEKPTKIPLLVRNQQRVAVSFVPQEGEPERTFVPAVTALFGVDGVTFGVRPDGSTASPRASGLACISCAEPLTRAYPLDEEETSEPQPMTSDAGAPDAGADASASDAGADASASDGGADSGLPPEPTEACGGAEDALLCVSNDPWSSGEDRWRAVYEGVLPTSAENRGRFVAAGPDGESESGGLELVTESNPCAAGVLGEEDIALDYGACLIPTIEVEDPEDPEKKIKIKKNNPAGDQVVIVSRPLDRDYLSQLGRGDENQLELCAALKTELESNPRLRVAFEIRRAYEDRLVVREAMVRTIGDAKSFEDVRPCYEDTISFAVHSMDAFTVWGTDSGFQHRVRANDAGRCVVDPDPELALRAGRARPGCEFRNDSLQFKLQPAAVDDAQLIGVELVTSFTSQAVKLVMRASNLGFGTATVVTEQLRYSDVDGMLYLVDINDRGLVPIPLDQFPTAVTSGAFN